MFGFIRQPHPQLQGMRFSLPPERPRAPASVAFPFAFPTSSSTSTSNSVNICVPSTGGTTIAGVSIDGISVPCVMRCGKMFLPVRVLEKKILRPLFMSYISVTSKIEQPLLPSYYVTPNEASDLTTNVVCSDGTFNADVDLVVAYDDFRSLYHKIKSACLSCRTSGAVSCSGGWIQINNSVMPYVNMDSSKYLPLSIVQNAAQLLTDVDPSALQVRQMSPADCQFMNELCRAAGLQFVVDLTTPVVDQLTVCALASRVPIVRYLPNDDPFGNAIYVDMKDTETLSDHVIEGSTADNSIGFLQIVDVRGNAEPLIPEESNLGKMTSRDVEKPILETVVFRSRTVSSLRRPDGKNYLLLEAVCRVFFPSLVVDAFVNCLEHVLHVPLSDLTHEEQLHFIEFYKLPTNCLRCRKMVTLDDFVRFFPQIEYSFRPQCGDTVTAVTSRPVAVPHGNASNTRAVPAILQKGNARKAETPRTQSTTTVAARRSRKRVMSDVIVIDD